MAESPLRLGRRKPSQIKLTVQQAGYAKNRLAGMEPKEAAIEAGYSYDPKTVHRLTVNRNINQWMREALLQAGVTPETLAKTIAEGLQATTTKTATSEGKITDTLEVADYKARFDYVTLVTQLLGAAPPKEYANSRSGEANMPPGIGSEDQRAVTQQTNIAIVLPQLAEMSREQLTEFMQRRRDELLNGDAAKERGLGAT